MTEADATEQSIVVNMASIGGKKKTNPSLFFKWVIFKCFLFLGALSLIAKYEITHLE